MRLLAELQMSLSMYRGPLPPPQILEGYDKIVPGSAKEIIANALKQTEHRQRLESDTLRRDNDRSWGGLVAGFVVASGVIGLGFFEAALGHPGLGTFSSLTALAGLAAVFVYGSQGRRKEREEKSRFMADVGKAQTPAQAPVAPRSPDA
jgi:uncharacterized membrane protein